VNAPVVGDINRTYNDISALVNEYYRDDPIQTTANSSLPSTTDSSKPMEDFERPVPEHQRPPKPICPPGQEAVWSSGHWQKFRGQSSVPPEPSSVIPPEPEPSVPSPASPASPASVFDEKYYDYKHSEAPLATRVHTPDRRTDSPVPRTPQSNEDSSSSSDSNEEIYDEARVTHQIPRGETEHIIPGVPHTFMSEYSLVPEWEREFPSVHFPSRTSTRLAELLTNSTPTRLRGTDLYSQLTHVSETPPTAPSSPVASTPSTRSPESPLLFQRRNEPATSSPASSSDISIMSLDLTGIQRPSSSESDEMDENSVIMAQHQQSSDDEVVRWFTPPRRPRRPLDRLFDDPMRGLEPEPFT